MSTPDQTLWQAWQHHQAGDLRQAEALYRLVLADDPNHVEALSRLGLVCQMQDRLAECIDLYQKCLQLKPDIAVVHNNLGTALASCGNHDQAITCYQEAVRLQPDYAEAWTYLGLLQTARGHLPEALEACNRAVKLQDSNPEAWNNLGIVQFQLHHVAEAVDCFRQALTLRPQFPTALVNLGNALLDQGKLEEASDCYRRSLQLQPADTRALNSLAVVLRMQHQWAQAESLLRQSLSVHATNPKTHRELATLFHAQGRLVEALECYQRMLVLTPDDAEVRFLAYALGTEPPAQRPAENLINLFDDYAESFDRDLIERLEYNGPELLKAALAPAPKERELAILDLGCGTGLCGLQVRDWAKSLTGIDLSGQMLARARERGIYDALIQSELVPAVKQFRNQFDLALAGDVFIYIGDLSPLFQAVAQALRPGGRFAFTIELLEGEGYQVLPTGHYAHSWSYLRHIADMAGLREVSKTPAGFRRQSGQGVAGLIVVLAR
jgi:predicted TPR repeat methyltransferase